MKDLDKMIAVYAQDAVESGKKFQKTLDFSEQSIQGVEDICAKLYNDIPRGMINKLFKSAPSEDEIVRMSLMLGVYIGEVIKKQFGGNWTLETLNKSNTLVFTTNEIKIYPAVKVYKRLKNGPGENLYHYYRAISREISKAG